MILVILLILSFLILNAQEYDYIKLTTQDGLPSDRVFGALEDKKGFLWFYTDNGVAKWDGNHITNFSVSDGLPDQSIWYMHEDQYERKWVFNNLDFGYYIFEDSVYKFNYDRPLVSTPWNIYCLPHGFSIIMKDSIFTIAGNQVLKNQNNNDKLTPIQLSNPDRIIYQQVYTSKRIPKDLIPVIKNAPAISDFELSQRYTIFTFSNYQVLINTENNDIIHIKEDVATFHPAPDKPASTSIPIIPLDSNIIVADAYSQREFNHVNNEIISDTIYENSKTQINRTIKTENYIYILTNNDGLYIRNVNNNNNYSFYSANNNITNITKDSQGLVILMSNSNIARVENDTLRYIPIYDKQNIYDISPWNNHTLVFQKTKPKLLKDNKLTTIQNKRQSKQSNPLGYKDWVKNKDYEIGISNQAFTIYDSKNEKTSKILCQRNNDLHLHNNDIYLGTSWGILKIYSFNKTTIIDTIFNNLNCLNLFTFKDRLYCTIKEKGVAEIKDKKLNFILKTTDNINDVTTFDSTIYILSSNVIYDITISNKGNETNKTILSTITPFPTYNALLADEDHIYLGGKKGLITLTKSSLSNDQILPVISSISCDMNGHKAENNTQFNYQENNLIFEFHATALHSPKVMNYNYKLHPIDNEYISTKENTIRFANLAPGKYQFELIAVDGFYTPSEKQFFSFSIKQPWYKSTSFILASILTLVSLFLAFYKWRIRRITEKTEEKIKTDRRFASLELDALRAQMNPHFIFNTLAAIQNYLQQNDKEDAEEYLTAFAQLIRKFLDYSKKNTISINEEIKLLQLYSKLENKRFDNQVEILWKVDPELDIYNSFIPTLIIQPFIENAFVHGLFHQKNDKKLIVAFKDSEEEIMITIIDNGIGLEASQLLKKTSVKTHESHGMGIVRERIDTLNKIHDEKIRLKIFDLEACLDHPNFKNLLKDIELQKSFSGTIISLTIPYQ